MAIVMHAVVLLPAPPCRGGCRARRSWAAAPALAAFHARLRQRWVQGRDRLLGEKALALAVFAENNWGPDGSWEELIHRWNDEHPAGDALHSELSLNQFATETCDAWERLTGEVWPEGAKASAAASERTTCRLLAG